MIEGHDPRENVDGHASASLLRENEGTQESAQDRAGSARRYSLENSHNPFIFKGRVAAIFMVRLWFAEP
jgi:hypothetical protein